MRLARITVDVLLPPSFDDADLDSIEVLSLDVDGIDACQLVNIVQASAVEAHLVVSE